MGFSIGGFKLPSPRDITNSIFPGTPATLFPSSPDEPDSEAAAREEEARKAGLRRKIDVLYGIKPTGIAATDPDFKLATDAGTELEGEQTKLGDATRSYYTDALAKQYGKAERNARFAFARSGLLGGSGSVDAMTELEIRARPRRDARRRRGAPRHHLAHQPARERAAERHRPGELRRRR
jgi:hypothetical protein